MGEEEKKAETKKEAEISWAEVRPYLSLFDFASVPKTRAGWYVRLAVTLFALWLLFKRVNETVGPLVTARPPPPIPSEEIDDYKFRLPEHKRREIFTAFATAELAERSRAAEKNTWNGHLWSREDDRGHYERVEARRLAAVYNVSLTQVYLVLDEGIRNHWLAPNGKPLPATTPPWDPRTTW